MQGIWTWWPKIHGNMDMVGYGHPKYGLVTSKQYQPFVDPMVFGCFRVYIIRFLVGHITMFAANDPVHWLIESQLIGGEMSRFSFVKTPFLNGQTLQSRRESAWEPRFFRHPLCRSWPRPSRCKRMILAWRSFLAWYTPFEGIYRWLTGGMEWGTRVSDPDKVSWDGLDLLELKISLSEDFLRQEGDDFRYQSHLVNRQIILNPIIWLVLWNMNGLWLSIQLGISWNWKSSQLTSCPSFFRGVGGSTTKQ